MSVNAAPSSARVPSIPNTGNMTTTPWQYYIMGFAAIGALVNAVANLVLGNKSQGMMALAFSGVSFFAAYTIKNLSLTRKEAAQIKQYGGITTTYTSDIKKLKEENGVLQTELNNLKNQIEVLKEENSKIGTLTEQLEKSDASTKEQITLAEKVRQQYNKLEESLKAQVDLLQNKKNELEGLTNEQAEQVKKFSEKIQFLQASLEGYKNQNQNLSEELAKFQTNNENLKISIGNKDKAIANLRFQLKTDTENLQESNRDLKNEIIALKIVLAKLREDLKQREALSIKLEEEENILNQNIAYLKAFEETDSKHSEKPQEDLHIQETSETGSEEVLSEETATLEPVSEEASSEEAFLEVKNKETENQNAVKEDSELDPHEKDRDTDVKHKKHHHIPQLILDAVHHHKKKRSSPDNSPREEPRSLSHPPLTGIGTHTF